MDDLYTSISKETGVRRDIVKNYLFWKAYSSKGFGSVQCTPEEAEKILRKFKEVYPEISKLSRLCQVNYTNLESKVILHYIEAGQEVKSSGMSNNKLIRIIQTIIVVLLALVSPAFAQSLWKLKRKDSK